MKKTLLTLFCALMIPSLANAHAITFECHDNADGTIICKGGFDTGRVAKNAMINVSNEAGKTILITTLDDNGKVTFDKPDGAYTVTVDAGAGHELSIKSELITE